MTSTSLDAAALAVRSSEPLSSELGIEVQNLSMVYRRGRQETTALAGCNLLVHEHAWVSLLGASGCGKSTLLRILAGLVSPTAGHVSLGGRSPQEARAARTYALVSQQSVMLPWRKLLPNVELGLEVAKVPKAERRRRALEAIEMVGLQGFEQAYPNELSGGMRQRAAIARALTLQPNFLLMDEPFGALDELTRERMNFELIRVLRETEATLLLVTHSITESVILSDQVAVMSSRPGRIIDMVDINFGHDRNQAIRDDPSFGRYEAELRHALYGSVI